MKTLLHTVAILFFFTFSFNENLQATHAMGGNLSYQWLGGNDYNFTYYFYRDCYGIDAPFEVAVIVNSTSCAISDTFVIPNVSFSEFFITCGSVSTTCQGGAYVGIEEYVYSGTYTLPATCADWVFSISVSARNEAITNLLNPGDEDLYVETMLDNLNTPFNNSPVFTSKPTLLINTGSTQSLNFGATDPDGDVLEYILSQPMTVGGIPIVYTPGHSITEPILANGGNIFDGVTGIMNVEPSALQFAVVSVKVNEYRNGDLIGSMIRDVQVIVVSQTNYSPSISGIDSTASDVYISNWGDTISFMIYSGDLDVSQQLTMNWDATITDATFISDGLQHPTGTFTWITDALDVSPEPYIFRVEVSDDYCPYKGITSKAFQVFVGQYSTDSVWAGDANADYIVDLYDVLPIGIGYGSSGSPRPGASLNWEAQACMDWSDSFPSGVNYKHADCDGNGVINDDDLVAIDLNYGYFHNKGETQETNERDVPVLTIAATAPLETGVQNLVPVTLGSSDNEAEDVYGIAFTMNCDLNAADITSLSFDGQNSMLGASSIIVSFHKSFLTEGKIDVVLVRNNQTPLTGFGTLGHLVLELSQAYDSLMSISFSNVRMIDEDGNEKGVDAINGNVALASTTGINGLGSELRSWSIYPVPNDGSFNISTAFSSSTDIDITIMNNLGTELYHISKRVSQPMILPVDLDLPAGIYSCRITTDGYFGWKKFSVISE